MAEQVYRIEIPVEAIDNTGPGLSSAMQRVSKFEQSMARTEQRLQRINRTRWQAVVTLLDRAGPVIIKLDESLRRLTHRAWRISVSVVGAPFRALATIRDALFSIPNIVTGIITGAAATAGIVGPLKLAGNLEQARIGFETLLGSAERADAFLQDLMAFAIKTSFGVDSLQEYSKRMLAMGFAAEEIIPTLEAVGDAVAALGAGSEGIDRVTYALGQMRTAGRVNAGDMMQLTSVGIPAWEMLAEAMGKTVEEVRDLSARGLIPAEQAINAIMEGMRRRYAGLGERQSRTLLGLAANLQDLFQVRILTRWGEGLRQAVQPRLQALAYWFDENHEIVTRWGQAIEDAGRTAGEWVLTKLERLQEILADLASDPLWQQADAFGKLRILWERVVVEPFDEWWNSSGEAWAQETAAKIGNALVRGLANTLNAALPAIFYEASRVLPGGEPARPLSWLAAGGLAMGGIWTTAKLARFLLFVRRLRGAWALSRVATAAETAGTASQAVRGATTAVRAAEAASAVAAAAAAAEGVVPIYGPHGDILKLVTRTAEAAKTAESASRAARLLRGPMRLLGRAAVPLGIATDLLTIAAAEPGRERAQAIGGSVGGWAGLFAGMKAGAAAGAGLGALAGGVGAAPGAAVGAVLGGLAGLFGGDWLGSWIGGKVWEAREASRAAEIRVVHELADAELLRQELRAAREYRASRVEADVQRALSDIELLRRETLAIRAYRQGEESIERVADRAAERAASRVVTARPYEIRIDYRPSIRIEAAARADEVLSIIRAHDEELADHLAGVIAKQLGHVFANQE